MILFNNPDIFTGNDIPSKLQQLCVSFRPSVLPSVCPLVCLSVCDNFNFSQSLRFENLVFGNEMGNKMNRIKQQFLLIPFPIHMNLVFEQFFFTLLKQSSSRVKPHHYTEAVFQSKSHCCYMSLLLIQLGGTPRHKKTYRFFLANRSMYLNVLGRALTDGGSGSLC